MKRFLMLLCGLMAAFAVGWAQGFYYYEQWIDDNRSTIHTGRFAEAEQTVSFDAAGIPTPGLHFLNIIPYDESGVAGHWARIAFIVPETWPATNDAVMMEYWLSAYDQKATLAHGVTPEVSFSIDLSRVSPGLHFLNYRTLNSRGEGGPWKQIAFLMPETWPGTSDAVKVEYWVSAYDQTPILHDYTGPEMSFSIDISQMSYGLHFLNFRTLNERGLYGPWKQIMFLISNGAFDREEITYEYWIDNGDTTTCKGYMPDVLPITADLSALSVGKHVFHFRAKNGDGVYGDEFSTTFDLPFFLLGDVNRDKKVDVADVSATVNILQAEPEDDTPQYDREAANVNRDDGITIDDVRELVKKILGK